MQENIIFVSNGYDPIAQYKVEVLLSDFQFINEHPDREYTKKQKVSFKIRHQPEFTEGHLVQEDEIFKIISEQKISGVAPGQFGVIYNEEKTICLGSGVIA